MPSGVDLKTLISAGTSEREQFIALAERVAYLTKSSIEVRPAKSYSKKKDEVLKRKPANSYGNAAVRGLASALNTTLNPPGVNFFKLTTNPEIELNDAQQAAVDKFFRKEEKRGRELLARMNFDGWAQVAIEQNLVEGTNGVKVDPAGGLQLFGLNQVTVDRTGSKINWAVFEQYVDVPSKDEPDKSATLCLYTYVNWNTGEIWSQREDQDGPEMITGLFVNPETGESFELAGDNPKYWFVFGTEIPQFHNYGTAYYMDYLPLLEDIEQSTIAVKVGIRVGGQFFYVLDPTMPGEITPQRFARIQNFEVVPMAHGKVQPWTAGTKINEWEWVSRKLNEDGQRLLNLSAVGILNRRSTVKTATEVRALRAELETLIGATSSVLAQTLHLPLVEAIIEALGVRGRLAASPGFEDVPKEVIDKLVSGIVVTGAPDVARERELEKLQGSTEHLLLLFGERFLQQMDIRGYADTIYDSVGVNTDKVLKKEEVLKAEQEQEQEKAMAGQGAPVGSNGQLKGGRFQEFLPTRGVI